ncbi:hypothetical protein JM93_02473 [Roseibium hamelinense]|uniref:N-acetyltransferase domain-containing protein n=1 Tax=Roseibium hamelinense TaxID=150831 RepID=A0A562T1Q4_9HYPH|nr:GNAT family N-acetyltransferase [Roseibium hamelinense]MTI44606.1 GNAT family N-acetyltransferase [Roseibium hamelinense]TWI87233.1 hypothetical protein JM93_02473 [Roseibium hamelinense]
MSHTSLPRPDAPANSAWSAPYGSFIRLKLSDADLFKAHLLRLDPETRRDRFAMQASDRFLMQYVSTALNVGTIVFAYMEDGHVRASGEVRPIGGDQAVEAALCVEPNWRRRGIGTELMRLILDSAEQDAANQVYLCCLSTNSGMRALVSKFTPNVAIEGLDAIGCVDVTTSLYDQTNEGFLSKFASWLYKKFVTRLLMDVRR